MSVRSSLVNEADMRPAHFLSREEPGSGLLCALHRASPGGLSLLLFEQGAAMLMQSRLLEGLVHLSKTAELRLSSKDAPWVGQERSTCWTQPPHAN